MSLCHLHSTDAPALGVEVTASPSCFSRLMPQQTFGFSTRYFTCTALAHNVLLIEDPELHSSVSVFKDYRILFSGEENISDLSLLT